MAIYQSLSYIGNLSINITFELSAHQLKHQLSQRHFLNNLNTLSFLKRHYLEVEKNIGTSNFYQNLDEEISKDKVALKYDAIPLPKNS